MEVGEVLGIIEVDGHGPRSVQKCRQDDGVVHLQPDIQLDAVTVQQGSGGPLRCRFLYCRIFSTCGYFASVSAFSIQKVSSRTLSHSSTSNKGTKQGCFTLLQIFREEKLWTTGLSMPQMVAYSSALSIRSVQLFLAWIREKISQDQFSLQVEDPTDLGITLGSSPPMQLTIPLSHVEGLRPFVETLVRALANARARLATLEKNVADMSGVKDAILPSPQKKRAPGMSSINPQNRKRKPARGLNFSDDEDCIE
ncbi:hypothetical protein SprV_0802576700 [Sparganum proliferum]